MVTISTQELIKPEAQFMCFIFTYLTAHASLDFPYIMYPKAFNISTIKLSFVVNPELSNQLIIKVRPQLKKYEKFVNALLADKKLRTKFIQDPFTVLGEKRLTPPLSRTKISLANKLLLYILGNKRLMQWIIANSPRIELSPEEVQSIRESVQQNGILQIEEALQLKILESALSQQIFIQNLLTRIFKDDLIRSILPHKLTSEILRSIVKELQNIHTLQDLDSLLRGIGPGLTAFVVLVAVVLLTAAVHNNIMVTVWAAVAAVAVLWVDVYASGPSPTPTPTPTTEPTPTPTPTPTPQPADLRGLELNFIINASILADALQGAAERAIERSNIG